MPELNYNLLIGIGDIHGHYPALEKLLSALDKQYALFTGNFLRNDAKIIFTGDYIDRGNSNIPVLKTLMALSENKNIIQLFGNHELMALANLEIAKDLVSHGKGLYDYIMSMHGLNGGLSLVSEFSKSPDKALKLYSEEMSRSGKTGQWLRKLLPFYVDNSLDEKILFVHGGIPPSLANPKSLEDYLDEFNKRITMSTTMAGGSFKKYFDNPLLGPESMFWDRSMHTFSKEQLEEILLKLKVDKIVVGHTPHKTIINYHNKMFDIDVGMSPRFGENTPTAIIFKKQGVYSFDILKGEKRIN